MADSHTPDSHVESNEQRLQQPTLNTQEVADAQQITVSPLSASSRQAAQTWLEEEIERDQSASWSLRELLHKSNWHEYSWLWACSGDVVLGVARVDVKGPTCLLHVHAEAAESMVDEVLRSTEGCCPMMASLDAERCPQVPYPLVAAHCLVTVCFTVLLACIISVAHCPSASLCELLSY